MTSRRNSLNVLGRTVEGNRAGGRIVAVEACGVFLRVDRSIGIPYARISTATWRAGTAIADIRRRRNVVEHTAGSC